MYKRQGNYPAASTARKLIRLDGHGVCEILDAILTLFPLDTYVEEPVLLMEKTPGDTADTSIWNEYKAIVEKHQPGTKVGFLERFAFYDRAAKSYAVIATGETAVYANVILKKGVVK